MITEARGPVAALLASAYWPLMREPPRFDQQPGELIDVTEWEPDQDFQVMPVGQKPKRALICPSPPPYRFLIGGHRYMFKHPHGRSAQQIWSEIIAYRVAKAIGIDVPPAFLAHDGTGTPGVLIEFFFGFTDDNDARFVHARDRLQAHKFTINAKHGSLLENIRLSRLHHVGGARSWWAETIAFDTLIGNTDRHSENWGFLVWLHQDQRPTYQLAPAFDNGSSLGNIIQDRDLAAYREASKLKRFIEAGTHHCGWLAGDKGSAKHINLCQLLTQRYATVRGKVAKVAEVSDARLEEVVQSCVMPEHPVPFTTARAEFVYTQLTLRRAILRRCLGG
jgi:hypothetical protein